MRKKPTRDWSGGKFPNREGKGADTNTEFLDDSGTNRLESPFDHPEQTKTRDGKKRGNKSQA